MAIHFLNGYRNALDPFTHLCSFVRLNTWETAYKIQIIACSNAVYTIAVLRCIQITVLVFTLMCILMCFTAFYHAFAAF